MGVIRTSTGFHVQDTNRAAPTQRHVAVILRISSVSCDLVPARGASLAWSRPLKRTLGLTGHKQVPDPEKQPAAQGPGSAFYIKPEFGEKWRKGVEGSCWGCPAMLMPAREPRGE